MGDNNKSTKFKKILLRSHWVNFKQTWHKASMGNGDSSLLKWIVPPFSMSRWLRNSKNTLTKFDTFLLQNHQLGKSSLGWKIQVCWNERPCPLQRGKMGKKNSDYTLIFFKSSSPEPLGKFQPYLAQSILG